MDEPDLRVRSDIDQYGWHVAKIAGDEQAPPWAFTIGLEHSFEHPEVIVFGMELDLLHGLLNHIGEQVKRGRQFEPDERAAGILAQNPPVFRAVAERWLGPFVGNAAWFYRERSFRVLQCFWPDAGGSLPWEPEFDSDWKSRQPLLYVEDEQEALGEALSAVLRAEGAL